jgi:glycerophosphoryl diester phosphodiesterase
MQHRMKRIVLAFAIGVLLLVVFVIYNNVSLTPSPRGVRPILFAHRGLAQTFDSAGVTGETCTASRIHPPEHPYLENTLASMAAAFRLGANVVEFDIHPTTDGHFAVFHDWSVECRTDGKGITREKSLAELRALDVGYGYTADGGKTFPFRGRGVGLIPSLDEVLATFPDKRLLINVKSNDRNEGEMLAARLARLSPEQCRRLTVYGGRKPVEVVRQRLPDVRTLSAAWEKQCLLRYVLVGWTGYVPKVCDRGLLLVPSNYARWLWGWPELLIRRMRAVSTEVVIVGPRQDNNFSTGIDTEEDFRRLPPGYTGGVWTNRIDRIAPLVAAGAR